jgi:hypothetical protein
MAPERTLASALLLLAWAWLPAARAEERRSVSLGEDVRAEVPRTQGGVLVCRVASPWQPGRPRVRILAPDPLPAKEERTVLFVLPVEPAPERRWGDGFETVRKLDTAERFGFILVAPSFAQWPWYCDHPTAPAKRQETYLLKAVLPLVMTLYGHEPRRRALLGFSKSGWGAWSLLLRHPDQFGAAAAWDAPMMMAQPRYRMAEIVGTPANFQRYRVPRLLEAGAEPLRGRPRLALLGYGNFRRQHQECHALMERLRVPHLYADGPRRRHHWDSGWVPDALQALHRMLRQPHAKPQ